MKQWMARAGAEYRKSARTWMATFTMSPLEHEKLAARAVLCGSAVNAFHEDYRKWIYLLRGFRAYQLRRSLSGETSYLAVAELHDSEQTSEEMRGRPHYHALLHERMVGTLFDDTECEWAFEKGSDGNPERVYRLKDQSLPRLLWPFGFTKIRLCFSEAAAVYVCKYVRKDGSEGTGRVKASPGYGGLSSPVESVLSEPEGSSVEREEGVASPRG